VRCQSAHLRPALAVLGLVMMIPCARADPDPVAGKAVFAQCLACHTIDAGAPDQVGPNLRGVLGKPAATNRAGFQYSEALKKSGLTWDDATLDAWIRNPAVLVPGTKMEFVGLTKREKRENVIAYLKQALN
jgi:cytochrome c